MRDWVVSIGTGLSQAPLIKSARESGYSVLGIDRSPNRLLVDDAISISTFNSNLVLQALVRRSESRHFCAVLARTSGPAVHTAALVASRLGLPGCGTGFAAASVSKSALRTAANSVGVDCIQGHSRNSVPVWLEGQDWVVKPDQPLYGKRNVYRVRDKEHLATAFSAAADESVNNLVEFQPYHSGRDIGVMLALFEGKPLWHFIYEELVVEIDGQFNGQGVTGPAQQVASTTSKEMCQAAERLALLWGTTGFAFFSFRLPDSGPALLYEVNPGLCGDGLADNLFPSLWPGVNFFSLDVSLMTGGKPSMPQPPARCVSFLDGNLIYGKDLVGGY